MMEGIQLILSVISAICLPIFLFILTGIRADIKEIRVEEGRTREIISKHCSNFEIHCKRPFER